MDSSWSSTRSTSAQEAMGSSSSSSSSGRIINCPDCGKRVPALNLELHQMRGQCLQTDIPVATPVPVAGTAVPLFAGAGAGPHSHMKESPVPNNSSSSRSSHALKLATDHNPGSGTYQHQNTPEYQHHQQQQQKQEDDAAKRRSWLPPSLRRRRPRPNGSSPGGPDRYSSRASPSYVGNSSVSTYSAAPNQRMPSAPQPPPHPSSHSSGSLYASNQHTGPTSSYSSYVDMTEEDPTEKDDHEVLHVRDVVNLADKYDSSDDDEDDDSTVQAEWACPRCTLLNPFTTDCCEACQYSNPVHGSSTEQPSSDETTAHSSLVNVNHAVRNPDPVRRERLVDDDYMVVDYPQHQQPSSSWDQNTGPTVGAGAILGTVLGAAGALVRGRNVGSGALHGAVRGAVGGAIVDQVFRDRNPMPPRRSQSMGPNTMHPPPTRNYPTHDSSATAEGTDMMHMLLNSIMINGQEQGHGYGQRVAHPDVDGMSYEQLLQVFGDGTRENRGAEPAVIDSLPSQTIQNVEQELPEDKRSCHICLEDFTTGDTRRTLPCLHGFHEGCIDRWLRSCATCPVCKHSVS